MSSFNINIISNISLQQLSHHQRPQIFASAAKFLGASKKEIRDQLNRGKSLADIAKDQNKNVDDLKQAMLSAVAEDKKAYYAGKVDQMIAEHPAAVTDQTATDSALSTPQDTSLDPIAQFLGLSKKDLSTQVDQGKSLVDIAKAQSKSVEDLKKTIVNTIPPDKQAALAQDVEQLMQARQGPATGQTVAGRYYSNQGSGFQPPPPSSSAALTGSLINTYF